MDNIDEQIDTVSRAVLALDGELRPLPRPQVRPDPDDRLLRPGRHLPQHRPVRRRAEQDGRRRPGLLRHEMLLQLGPESAARPRTPKKIEQAKKALAKAQAEFETLRDNPEGNAPGPDGRPEAHDRPAEDEQAPERAARTDRPGGQRSQVALGVREAKTVGDTEIRIRGEAEKLGPTVPAGSSTSLEVPDAAEGQPASRAAGSSWRSG